MRQIFFGAVASGALLLSAGAQAQGPSPFGLAGVYLTKGDLDLIRTKIRPLLAKGKIGSVAAWRNAKSGAFGTIELEQNLKRQGLTCHRIAHVMSFKNQSDPKLFRLVYCRVGDAWKIAS